jgi:hypothetical protein
MLDTQSLEQLIARERLKDEALMVERSCECIVHRFDDLDREPTREERDARRQDYIDMCARLEALKYEINSLTRRFG